MSFLGIRIQPDVARLVRDIDIPGIKSDSAQLHITLLHLGKEVPIKHIAKAMTATFGITSKTEPFWAKITSVNYFEPLENKPYPIIAPVISSELMKMQKSLKRAFNKARIDYSKNFKDYNPHITLSLHNEPINKTKIEPIEWTIQEIVLWGGDDGDEKCSVIFPLEIPKNGEISELCCLESEKDMTG
jgi:2'-5' RNA ligase